MENLKASKSFLSRHKLFVQFLWVLIIVGLTILYGYTQFVQKDIIKAILQYQINLNTPPENVFAVSTFDQLIQGSKKISKGTRFIGMVSKNEKGETIVNFNALQRPDGKLLQISASSNLSGKIQADQNGVSAKISKTLYKQTRTNVLGAIFTNQEDIQQFQEGLILPRGLTLDIEVN